MAKRTPRARSGKPLGKPPAVNGKPPSVLGKPPAAEPERLVIPDTVDGIVAAIGAVCDQIDEAIEKPRQYGFHLRQPGYDSPLRKLNLERLNPLTEALGKLLNPKVEPNPDNATEVAAEVVYQDPLDYLKVALHGDRGKVPTWSRPGVFLVWFGPIPVRCTWFGAFDSDCHLEAVNPRELWFDEDATVVAGTVITPNDKSVDAVFKRHLKGWGDQRDKKGVPMMKLRHLKAEQAQVVNDFLSTHRWLHEAMRMGPINPVPMPQHLLLAQPALIG
jgi:hypothetical protein